MVRKKKGDVIGALLKAGRWAAGKKGKRKKKNKEDKAYSLMALSAYRARERYAAWRRRRKSIYR